ncbi:MAG: inositol monophosphatase [Actinomycetota bacterium]|nr:inositol monophosphatase [Actinomycetota bacterium]
MTDRTADIAGDGAAGSAGSGAAGVELDELLAVALDAATQAGRLLVDRRPHAVGVTATKSSPTDVVTEMDTAAQDLIVRVLRAARPHDGILGEEGTDETGSTAVRWVVDPIDGTVNYLYGYPGWAVSVAAQVGGESVVGVVAVPAYGETFTAVRGRGAWCNATRLRRDAGPALDRALVATGFSYDASIRLRQATLLTGVLPRVRDIRRGGAAAVDLCLVACGRVDAYYESGTQLWDIAAGTLVATEAGAHVGGGNGAGPGPDLVLAAAPGLFEPLHDLLTAAAGASKNPAARAGEAAPASASGEPTGQSGPRTG